MVLSYMVLAEYALPLTTPPDDRGRVLGVHRASWRDQVTRSGWQQDGAQVQGHGGLRNQELP